MKNILLSTVLVVLLSIGFTSCKDNSMMNDDENILMQSTDSPELVHEQRMMMRNIEQADLDRPFIDDFDGFMAKHEGKRKDMKAKHETMKSKMAEKLNLTDEQKTEMENLREEFKNCSLESKNKIKTILESIFTEANVKRESIKSDLENNTISKDEAKKLMKELKNNVKEEIKANSEIASLKEEIKICAENQKEKISEILTAEQLEQLKEMRKSHGHKRKR
jgi:hypothetical protein